MKTAHLENSLSLWCHSRPFFTACLVSQSDGVSAVSCKYKGEIEFRTKSISSLAFQPSLLIQKSRLPQNVAHWEN